MVFNAGLMLVQAMEILHVCASSGLLVIGKHAMTPDCRHCTPRRAHAAIKLSHKNSVPRLVLYKVGCLAH